MADRTPPIDILEIATGARYEASLRLQVASAMNTSPGGAFNFAIATVDWEHADADYRAAIDFARDLRAGMRSTNDAPPSP